MGVSRHEIRDIRVRTVVEQTNGGDWIPPKKYTCFASSRSSDFFSFSCLAGLLWCPSEGILTRVASEKTDVSVIEAQVWDLYRFGEGFCVAHRSYGSQVVEILLSCNIKCVG